MRLAISQSNYLPWIGYFKLIAKVDNFVFYDQVQYTKNDWRNRNRIMLHGTARWITIPVRYRFSDCLSINQIRLPAGNWREEHLERISDAYSDQNDFNLHFASLKNIISADYQYLSQLNQKIIKYYANLFEVRTNFHTSHTINLKLDRNQRIIETCKDFSADTYVCSPKSLNYLDQALFEKNGIKVEVIDYDNCLSAYRQNSNAFDPFVSFIDVLFMTGMREIKSRLGSSGT